MPAPQRSVVSAGGAPGRRPRRPAVIAVAVVAALALVGAGVAFLPRLLGGAAAGPQPAVVVPSTAVAYASLDLNPGLTQKAAAVQFLSKFPTFQGQLTEASDLADDLAVSPDEPLHTVASVPAHAHGAQRFLTLEAFRQAGFERSIKGRSWAIHDGILGCRWECPRMYHLIEATDTRGREAFTCHLLRVP